MFSDTIIEGLMQGNAIEMELVNKLKDGLNIIADGMQPECYNRSDALRELKEKLAADTRRKVAAAKEILLSERLEDMSIFTIICCSAIDRAGVKLEEDNATIEKEFWREMKTIEQDRLRNETQKKKLIKMSNLVDNMWREASNCAEYMELVFNDLASLNVRQGQALQQARSACREKKWKRMAQAKRDYQIVKAHFEESIKGLFSDSTTRTSSMYRTSGVR